MPSISSLDKFEKEKQDAKFIFAVMSIPIFIIKTEPHKDINIRCNRKRYNALFFLNIREKYVQKEKVEIITYTKVSLFSGLKKINKTADIKQKQDRKYNQLHIISNSEYLSQSIFVLDFSL